MAHNPDHYDLSREELIERVADFLFIAYETQSRIVLASAENDCLREMLCTIERLEAQ